METGKSKEINGQPVRFASLEVLLVLKYRAAHTQDIEDLQMLAQRKFQDIRWEIVQRLTSETEYPDLKNTIVAFRNI